MAVYIRILVVSLVLFLLGPATLFGSPSLAAPFPRSSVGPASPIYTAKLDQSLALRLTQLCLKLEKQSTGRFVSNCGGWQSRDLVTSKEELSELVDSLHVHLAEFLQPGGPLEPSTKVRAVADQIWANINRPGNFNRRHDHGTGTASFLASGVFYCQCHGNAALRLYPEDQKVRIIPEPGLLVLFPPDMEHDVEALPPGANERISIAFNLRTRWIQEKWQEDAVDGTLQVGEMEDLQAADLKLGLTAMHLAAEAGHIGVLKQLLQHGAYPSISWEGWSPLGLAVDQGHRTAVELLLAAPQPQPVVQPTMRQTGVATLGGALKTAAFRGHRWCLQRLMDGSNSHELLAAAFAAAAAGQVEVLDEFLRVVDPTASLDNRTLVHEAAGSGHTQVIRQLLRANAELQVYDQHKASPLHEAAAKGHVAAVRHLVSAKALVNDVDCEGKEALHWSVIKGHEAVAKVLLERKAQVSLKAQNGETPLHLASRHGHVSLAKILLEHGATTNETSLEGKQTVATATILRTGNLWSRERFAAFLSRKSAKVPAQAASDYASSVHHAAAAAGHVKVLRLLSQDSAPDDFVDEEGGRPLHWASANGHVEVVHELLNLSMDHLNSKDMAGSSPLHDAVWGGHLRVAEVLLDAKASINALDSNKQTALHAAASLLMEDMVSMLLLRGIDVWQRDSQGRNAQQLAQVMGWNADLEGRQTPQKRRETTGMGGCRSYDLE